MSHASHAHRVDALGRQPSRESGFTIAELTISLLMLSILLAAILFLFDYNNKLSRAQTHVSEMQQSLRIAQYQMVRNVRMAGRGGLIRGTIDNPVALSVRNNVPVATTIAVGDAGSPTVVPETDVLTIRGVFESPIYHVNPPAAALTLVLDAVTEQPVSGTILVVSPVPTTGVPQDLSPLIQAINEGRREALVLVSPLGGSLYGVVELDPGASTVTDEDNVTAGFQVTGGVHTEAYNSLSPGGVFPQDLRAVAYVGILEEYRYYVREQFAIPGDPTSEPMPRLSQARFFPGTEIAYNDSPANLRVDIADNILDLQVALGIGAVVPVKDDPPTAEDEWLFNHPEDDPTDAAWDTGNLAYVRINTLARTPRPDLGYVSEPIAAIEDRIYDEPDEPAAADRLDRAHRRRVLQSIVELRNL